MHPAVSLVVENALQNQHLFVPLLFAVLGTVASVNNPLQHSLLVTAVSWALIWIPAVFRAGIWNSSGASSRKAIGLLAGGCLALADICDRAACDKEGILSTKGLLPVLVVVVSENDFLGKHLALPSYLAPDDSTSESGPAPERQSSTRSFRLLGIATVSATVALASRYTTTTTTALGLSSVIFAAVGMVLFEGAINSVSEDSDSPRGLMSANGTFSRRSPRGAQRERQLAALRDVAVVMAVLCGIASYVVEPAISPRAISWDPVYRQLQGDWKTLHYQRTIQLCVLMVFVNVLSNTLLFFMLLQQGAVNTSFFALFSYICARLNVAHSWSGIWFTLMSGSAALLFFYSSSSSTPNVDVRSSIRPRRIVFGIAAVLGASLLLRYVSGPRHPLAVTNDVPPNLDTAPPFDLFAPITLDMTKGHPADQLTSTAEKEFEHVAKKQSKSLAEAVQEYRRRNGVAPPPHFDKWYQFAVRNKVQLIDEFDTISHALLPFWALKPSSIRARVALALGNEENSLIGVMIRNGEVVKIENGQEWQQQATVGMMKDFVQYLPDMDLAFNAHDEPRVVVPQDQLSVLLRKAQDEAIPKAKKTKTPRNSFSPRPSDLNDGKRFEVVTTSRFNRFAHQQTWTHSRLSCPIDSQARNYEENVPDNFTSWAAAPLNYVYNQTAFSDICNSPSFGSTFGFFERPNAFNIIHELTPIFSQSKISSFQDILFPSPWYWFGKVGYDQGRDTAWENKTNSLYWRGSTTGGFSRNGGWRRQHRQHIVKRLNALDKAQILVNRGDGTNQKYEVQEVERQDFEKFVNVKFSHIGQCDPGDCDAQKEFFHLTERVDGQDAWYYKHLLDMDGNAFSGRFYAFLKSKSLTYKMAVFREWHHDWLWPWVHYIPISLNGTEHLDLVQWFGGGNLQRPKGDEGATKSHRDDNKGGNGDSIGEKKARQIAERSSQWASKVLRNVDFEAWLFRLLLEYGRIVDDDRDSIGYPGP